MNLGLVNAICVLTELFSDYNSMFSKDALKRRSGVMVIVTGYGHGNTSSNPGLD